MRLEAPRATSSTGHWALSSWRDVSKTLLPASGAREVYPEARSHQECHAGSLGLRKSVLTKASQRSNESKHRITREIIMTSRMLGNALLVQFSADLALTAATRKWLRRLAKNCS